MGRSQIANGPEQTSESRQKVFAPLFKSWCRANRRSIRPGDLRQV